jgi:hypothetical protein
MTSLNKSQYSWLRSRSRQENKLAIRAVRYFSVVDFMNKKDRLQAGYRQAAGFPKISCSHQMLAIKNT